MATLSDFASSGEEQPVTPSSLPVSSKRLLELLEEHRGILWRIARTYAATAADREDLAQEIVVQLWASIARFDGRVLFSTWMYRVALNTAISFHRRETRRQRHLLSDDERMFEVPAEEAEGPGAQELELLGRFIDGQDPLNKALLLLYLEGTGHREAGEIVGLREAAVAARISRLKKSLQEFAEIQQRMPKERK